MLRVEIIGATNTWYLSTISQKHANWGRSSSAIPLNVPLNGLGQVWGCQASLASSHELFIEILKTWLLYATTLPISLNSPRRRKHARSWLGWFVFGLCQISPKEKSLFPSRWFWSIRVIVSMKLMESMESPSQGLSQLSDTLQITVEEEEVYVVLGTIKNIVDEDDWYYTACFCNKAVYPDHKAWFCEKCNKHVYKVAPRYRVKVTIGDETDSTTFVIFDRDATSLFQKSCTEMYELQGKGSASTSVPKEIVDLKNKTFLFKVELKNNFGFRSEPSYRVKKLCSEVSIVNRFTELYMKPVSDVTFSYNTEKKANELALDIAQDLLPKFSSATTESESQSSELQIVDLNIDTIITPMKCYPESQGSQTELQIPLKMLKTKIKVEKNKSD